MNATTWSRDSLDLKKTLRVSLGLHLLILAGTFISEWISPSLPHRYVPSIRVDIIGLPEQTITEKITPAEKSPPESVIAEPKSKPAPKQIEKEAEKEEPTLSTSSKSRKKDMEKALARIRALSKISEPSKTTPAAQIKGNRVSAGITSGEAGKVSTEPSYVDLVLERVREHWSLPVWLSRRNLSAQVLIFIDSGGKIREMKFTQPSGDERFDQEVRKALTASQPFPLPDPGAQQQVSSRGILLGFPL